VEAALNEQQNLGADVITRIDHALHEPQGSIACGGWFWPPSTAFLTALQTAGPVSSSHLQLVTWGTPP